MTRKTRCIFVLYIFLFVTSCENTKYKSKIVQSYIVENEKAGNTLKIDNLTVLEVKDIGPEYGDTLIINHYLNKRRSNLRIIDNTKSIIALLDSNIIKYQKLLKIGKKSDIPKYEIGLKDTESRLVKQKNILSEIQDEIDTDYEKISYARSKSYSDDIKDFKKIEYIIVGTADSIQINDTLSIIFDEEMKWSFVKNDMYCNYLGK